jgi:hypothetical protein
MMMKADIMKMRIRKVGRETNKEIIHGIPAELGLNGFLN